MTRLAIGASALAALAFLGACGRSGGAFDSDATGARGIALDAVARLDDGNEPVLARPTTLSQLPDGRVVVADRSDRDVKVYGATGSRALTLGRAGQGPGEFSALMGAQSYRDSVLAYDFASGRVSIFGSDGRFARAFPIRGPIRGDPFRVRVVDDSLFLLSAPPGAGNLLALVRPNGSKITTFFDRSDYFRNDPALLQHSDVFADAADGVVFAGLAGGDSVWAFDYRGRLLGSGPVDPDKPLTTTRALLAGNRGKPRRGDGSWVMDGNRVVISVVALDSGRAAIQVAAYDAKRGIDPLEGGTLLVTRIERGKRIASISRFEGPGGLLGRDAGGNALLLRYAPDDMDRYELLRMRLTLPSTAGDRP